MGTRGCNKCGKPVEESRPNSKMCRSCDTNRPIKSTDQLLRFAEEFNQAGLAIMQAKNSDYGADADPFANFHMHGILGIHVRMCDKMSRIHSFIKKGELKVKDESVLDSLIDLHNYCILFAGYLRRATHNELAK